WKGRERQQCILAVCRIEARPVENRQSGKISLATQGGIDPGHAEVRYHTGIGATGPNQMTSRRAFLILCGAGGLPAQQNLRDAPWRVDPSDPAHKIERTRRGASCTSQLINKNRR